MITISVAFPSPSLSLPCRLHGWFLFNPTSLLVHPDNCKVLSQVGWSFLLCSFDAECRPFAVGWLKSEPAICLVQNQDSAVFCRYQSFLFLQSSDVAALSENFSGRSQRNPCQYQRHQQLRSSAFPRRRIWSDLRGTAFKWGIEFTKCWFRDLFWLIQNLVTLYRSEGGRRGAVALTSTEQ